MFRKLVHSVMIVLLLVCPAMGGRCCSAAGTETADSVAVESCHSCPCHEAPARKSVPNPRHHDCPQSCHDCICEGALPAGPTASEAMKANSVATEMFLRHSFCSSLPTVRKVLSFDVGPPPLGNGRRLATLCVLRI
jgi:hypothetical protein